MSKERLSLDSRTSLSHIPNTHPKRSGDSNTHSSFADSVRTSLVKRGYNNVLPVDPIQKGGLLQFRRRGLSDSTQFYPLQITIPPPTTLFDLAGRFENPRKAPVPEGLRYSSVKSPPLNEPQLSAVLKVSTPTTALSATGTEFRNLTNASIFALPKFNLDKEMRLLQNLWTKRSLEIGDSPPFIYPTSPLIDVSDLKELQVAGSNFERSYFESDTETDDENDASKRYLALFLCENLIVEEHGC